MDNIKEQIRYLRELATDTEYNEDELKKALNEAANTIEELSGINKENRKKENYKHCEDCENFIPLPSGIRGGKRGHCKKRYPRDSRSGRVRACKQFSEAYHE